MSQEWDEVLNEFALMIKRLNDFQDDLLAAADGGELTHTQRKFAQDSTVIASGCLSRLLELHVEATFETAEQGDGG